MAALTMGHPYDRAPHSHSREEAYDTLFPAQKVQVTKGFTEFCNIFIERALDPVSG